MSNKQFVNLFVIADRKQKDKLTEELIASGGALINVVFGRGYHESRTVYDYLGFAEKKGKVIINCLISRDKSIELIETLNEDYGFKLHNSGIAFTIPVTKIVY